MAEELRKKVVILGATGMIGSGVYRVLKDDFNLTLIARKSDKVSMLHKSYGFSDVHKVVPFDFMSIYKDYKNGFEETGLSDAISFLFKTLEGAEAIINCAGIVRPHSDKNPEETVFVNAIIPHLLSWRYSGKLIHVSSSCIFDGIHGAPYTEESRKNPSDIYGLSKAAGEPENALTLRASIIGPELTNHYSLFDWLKTQEGKEIKGYTNRYWNGITSLEFGKVCKKIIEKRDNFPASGIYHIFSEKITKYELLSKLKDKLGVHVVIKESEALVSKNRTLDTIHPVCGKLGIPDLSNQLLEL